MDIEVAQHAGYWGVKVNGKFVATFADMDTAAHYADALEAEDAELSNEERAANSYDPIHDDAADLADEQNDWKER